jgi:addiction module HigA family antidote
MTRKPIHPGEILAEELAELNLSARALAKALHVPSNRISQILCGKRGISADTALRLSRFFGTSVEFWQNLQCLYERDLIDDETRAAIESEIMPSSHVSASDESF